eukprot:CAMPEP_0181104960 /NCGR_PEP_ID=MMETSP1071-20121207/15710_1 /TAXON_ID=35127 /ORGANISM="Thalassiosira sp., Strain NH16" /LENGTH=204 /DNA_ID=CAMNT_0023188201 /DNA_START=106 /DNA_END=717 /DNA_ORIENTATION=-
MHAGQLRYHDFALLREARERSKLRWQSSSSSSLANVALGFGNYNHSSARLHQPLASYISTSPQSMTARFFGGLSTARTGYSNHNSTIGNDSLVPNNNFLNSQQRQQHPSQIGKRTFLTSLRTDLHLKGLERAANAQPANPQSQYEFLSELSRTYPDAVVARFEQYGEEFAVDERIASLYLDAVQRSTGGGGGNRFALKRFVERL